MYQGVGVTVLEPSMMPGVQRRRMANIMEQLRHFRMPHPGTRPGSGGPRTGPSVTRGMMKYASTHGFGDDAPNPTPWVVGAILLTLAVAVPALTKRIPVRSR